MEAFALYLLKSVIWLTAFALVYIVFLRNERFFELNRLFLVSGIAASLLFPFLSFTYAVVMPAVSSGQTENMTASVVQGTSINISNLNFRSMLLILYLAGILLIAVTILKQGRSLFRVIRKAGKTPSYQVKLVKTDEYDSAFSFFSWIFVNPSFTDVEIREIMNHEMVHIRQKHWLDLMLAELLCLIQWFNPVIWIYIRLIRQNHEYIADKVALQRTSDPAVYKAALLNQIVGSQVISLANSFNYSLNKKRFTMMENIFNSPYRKMKLLLILPVFAIVFYAFAKPDYQYSVPPGVTGSQNAVPQTSDKKISGSVVQKDGNPLQGAHVLIANTSIGTSTDDKGNFSLENVPADAAIVVTYVGFKSKVIKSEFVSKAPIKMERDTISYVYSNSDMPAPPPPPPPSSTGVKESTKVPPPPPPPSTGAQSNTGNQNDNEKVFIAVEELPEFPGGNAAMQAWIINNRKYPAVRDKVTGKVEVTFVVTKEGKVTNVTVKKALDPKLDKEAVSLISSMPDWKPGIQHGKAVDVQMMVPVEYK
jgi:TonB family protein